MQNCNLNVLLLKFKKQIKLLDMDLLTFFFFVLQYFFFFFFCIPSIAGQNANKYYYR